MKKERLLKILYFWMLHKIKRKKRRKIIWKLKNGTLNAEWKERALKHKSILLKGKSISPGTLTWWTNEVMRLRFKERGVTENKFYFPSQFGSYISHSIILIRFAVDCGVENIQTRLIRRHCATTLGVWLRFFFILS